VDTGEVLTGVEVLELRLLKQFLIQYPMMAVKMRLSGVEMPDSREWSKEVTDYFNELSHCDAPVRVSVDSRVVSQHEAATVKAYAVTAYVIRDDHDLCINADLVNKKLAKLQDPSGPHYRTVKLQGRIDSRLQADLPRNFAIQGAKAYGGVGQSPQPARLHDASAD